MPARFPIIALALAATFALSACANTVRGVGADLGNTVDATEGAVNDVAN